MPRTKLVNGIEFQLTSEEEKARDVQEAKAKKDADEYAKVAYKDKRKFAYPEIGDQLDDLLKKGAFSDEMSALLNKVKADHPKP